MLYIKSGVADDEKKPWYSWHVGFPLPKIVLTSRVITFQADGDELVAILEGLKPFKQFGKGDK